MSSSDNESEDGKGTPFSKEEIKRIKKLLDEQFEREKEEAAYDGMVTCLWSGRRVCFCKCGPHIYAALSITSTACLVDSTMGNRISPKESIRFSSAGCCGASVLERMRMSKKTIPQRL
jgi:hypothetical protein